MLREGRRPDAGGDGGDVDVRSLEHACLRDGGADRLGDPARGRGIRAGQDDHELVAPEAGGQVAGPELARDRPADEADRPAPDQVALAVHQGFEIVQVEDEQRERPPARQQLGEHAVEVPGVPEAGQVVGDRGELRLPIERGILDRDGGVVGQRLDQA